MGLKISRVGLNRALIGPYIRFGVWYLVLSTWYLVLGTMDHGPMNPWAAPYSNGGIYGKSQESVISPKYLFAHPMYQGTTNSYKVHPSHAVSNNPRSHYEQVDQNSVVTGAPVQPPRVVFDRDCHDELQHFNAMLTQFTNSQNNMGQPITQNTKRANSTMTSQTAKSVKSDQFSLHCEADNECEDGSEEDEASSLTASHKSDNY